MIREEGKTSSFFCGVNLICNICNGSGSERINYDEVGLHFKLVDCRGCKGTGEVKPKVLNRHLHGTPNGSVYIGRGTEWGNPFQIGRDGTRDEVIDKFREWFIQDKIRVNNAKTKLRGKHLVCSCSPNRCHGDFLIVLANMEEST